MTALIISFGCATAPQIKDISSADFDYADKLIVEQNWSKAYRAIELYLVSPNQAFRQRAITLIEQHPQIRVSASQTFTKEAFLKSSNLYGSTAPIIEKQRLVYYKETIATINEYEEALRNYQEYFEGGMEDEIQSEWIGSSAPVENRLEILLSHVEEHKLTRKQFIAILGRPTGVFEDQTILTYRLAVKENRYLINPSALNEVTHHLVLVFDKDKRLVEHSFVELKND